MGKKKQLYKKWSFWVIVILTLAALGLIAYFAISITAEKNVEYNIDSCMDETKKDMLGFVSKCYEDNSKEIPEEIKNSDKIRADRILAQEAYDVCMANAAFNKAWLWDINDKDVLNAKGDSSYKADFVNKEYDQDVDECKIKSPLSGSYEENYKTYYAKVLVGWKEPKNYTRLSENIPILDRYNNDGKINEASNIPLDQEVPENIGTVGGKIAREFKEKHLDWWY